jgi:hypothetical protein
MRTRLKSQPKAGTLTLASFAVVLIITAVLAFLIPVAMLLRALGKDEHQPVENAITHPIIDFRDRSVWRRFQSWLGSKPARLTYRSQQRGRSE